MQWFYSAHGQQQGPISPAELEALARAGTVTPETLVWREGLPNWTPYSVVAASAVLSPGSTSASLARCAECGQSFPKDDMVAFENAHICVSCKPRYFQKLREGVAAGGAGIWRYKKQLVTTLNPTLPARCIKCNAPTDTPQKKRNLYWHHPLLYIAVPINVILYVIIAVIVRKRSLALVSICRDHRAQRRNAIFIGWFLALGGFATFIAGIANESIPIWALGAVAFVGGIIYGVAKGRLIYATRIDKEHLWLGGCGKDFLDAFPEWAGE